MAYSTADIRNIALVGQAGAGKTLLAESLLTESGAIRSRGSLERGTTVCDFENFRQTLDLMLRNERGLILLGGHFGNWEVLGYAVYHDCVEVVLCDGRKLHVEGVFDLAR